jgi:uncharacterized membrane protein YkoI
MLTAKVKGLTAAVVLITGVSISVFAKQENEPKIQGSIPTRGMLQSEYPKKSKLTPVEASAIALNQTPGSVLSIGLENEDGFLVYAVNVAGSSSGFHEVIVDAGNGQVLSSATKKNLGKEDEEDGEQDDD